MRAFRVEDLRMTGYEISTIYHVHHIAADIAYPDTVLYSSGGALVRANVSLSNSTGTIIAGDYTRQV